MRAGAGEFASPGVNGPSSDKPGETRADRHRCGACATHDSHMERHMQWIAERNKNCEPVDFEDSQPVDFEDSQPVDFEDSQPCDVQTHTPRALDPVGGQARARGRLATRRPITRTTRRAQARRARLARAAV